MNLNPIPITVTIDIMDYFGNVLTSSSSQSVLANQRTAWSDGTGNGAWRRFTVVGNSKKVRAIAVYDNASSYTISIPAY